MPLIPKQQPPYYRSNEQGPQTYLGIFTQNGATAAVITEIINTIGPIVWTWDNITKNNIGTLTGAFADKHVIIEQAAFTGDVIWTTALPPTDNTIGFGNGYIGGFDGLPTDSVLNITPIRITLYPAI